MMMCANGAGAFGVPAEITTPASQKRSAIMCRLTSPWKIATAATALAALVPSAKAQENIAVFACQLVGGAQSQPLGDRDGHTLSITQISCLAKAGVLSGGVLTGSSIYELAKGNGILITASGVITQPGQTAVYVATEGTLAFVMTDGKVTGTTTSGRGSYPIATGGWSALAGKPFTYSTHPTGPGLFEIDVTSE
jgi:hypothetical protein